MPTRVSASLLALMSLLLAAPAAHALTITYSSDADFLANAAFVKDWGANVRWGNGAANGDWEYSIVNASDIPIGAGNPRQHAWLASPSLNPHTGSLDFDSGLSQAVLSTSVFTSSSATVSTTAPTNALALRGRAVSPDAGNIRNVVVSFDLGGSVNLADLVGDSDAQYIVLYDSRLAGGFTVTYDGEIKDGSGSLPMYQFKVGHSTIPEPGTLVLLASGLAGLAFARRRA